MFCQYFEVFCTSAKDKSGRCSKGFSALFMTTWCPCSFLLPLSLLGWRNLIIITGSVPSFLFESFVCVYFFSTCLLSAIYEGRFVCLSSAFASCQSCHVITLTHITLQIWNGNSFMWDLLRMKLMINFLKACLLGLSTLATTGLFFRLFLMTTSAKFLKFG